MDIQPITIQQAGQLRTFLLANQDYFTDYQSQPPTLAEIRTEFFLEVPAGIPLANKQTLAVFAQEKMIGFIDLLYHYPDPKTCFLGLFVLHPDFRRQGYGQQLYDRIEAHVRHENFTALRLGVLKNNQPAKKMWRKQGYQVVGHVDDHPYGPHLIMEKSW